MKVILATILLPLTLTACAVLNAGDACTASADCPSDYFCEYEDDDPATGPLGSCVGLNTEFTCQKDTDCNIVKPCEVGDYCKCINFTCMKIAGFCDGLQQTCEGTEFLNWCVINIPDDALFCARPAQSLPGVR